MNNLRWLLFFLIASIPLSLGANELDPQLRKSIDISIPEAKKVAGNIPLFINLTKPLAPLDLNINKPLGSNASSQEKNFFYGVMGGAAGLNRGFNKVLINNFFARYQGEKVIEGISAKANLVLTLVKQFLDKTEINIVSTWGKDAYRVNNSFVTGATLTVFQCKGFPYFPCPVKEKTKLSKAPKKVKYLIDKATPLVLRLRDLELVAIVKEKSGVRVVIDGLADNEVGYFVPSSVKGKVSISDGKDIVYIKSIAPKVFFYAAN